MLNNLIRAKQIIASATSFLKDSQNIRLIRNLVVAHPLSMDESLRIAFCGRFNAGKSSLINVLLDDNIVVSSPIPSTCAITRIYYNKVYDYTVYEKTNNKIVAHIIDASGVQSNTVKKWANKESCIYQVDIGVPSVFLSEGIELFDTPGLDDDIKMTTITKEHLSKSDFVFFVVDSLQLKDLRDLLMSYYHKLGRNVLFIANKIDAIPNEDDRNEIAELAQVYYGDYFNPISYKSEIFYVSSRCGRDGISELFKFISDVLIRKKKRIIEISRLSSFIFEITEIKNSITNSILKLQQKVLCTNDRLCKTEIIDCIETMRSDKIIISNLIHDLKTLVLKLQIEDNDAIN